MPADKLIGYVFDRTRLPLIAEAKEAGASEYLSLLIDYARSYEKAGYRGLFGFINQVREALRQEAAPLKTGAAGRKGVVITSAHSSKGLEYPVVFLADLSKGFNLQDSKKPLLIHPRLGAGPKLADRSRGIEYPTLARLAAAAKIDNETLSEEMRVLYVAMTRAKLRLYAVCSAKEPEKTLETLRLSASVPLEPQALEDCRSMADWVLLAALSKEGEKLWNIGIIKKAPSDEAASARPEGMSDAAKAPRELVEKISAGLRWRYPRRADTLIPSKLTPTELNGRPRGRRGGRKRRKAASSRSFSASLRRPRSSLRRTG
jgi:ATP-dependent helicase/nuclease subunit A